MPSRPAGRLLDLEYRILEIGIELQTAGDEVYGFSLARHLSTGADSGLVGHGTLHKARARLGTMGLVDSEWEDTSVGESEGRPRRRLYRVTGEGQRAIDARPALAQAATTAARQALA